MSQGETARGPGDESTDQTTERGSEESRLSTATRYLKRGNRPGVLAGAGGIMALRGLRALRHGRRGRGLARLLGGVGLVAAALRRRQSGDGVDERDVASTSPDIGDVGGGAGADHAGGDEASAVAGSSIDIEDAAEPGSQAESTAGTETVDPSEVADPGVDTGDLADAVGDTAEADETTEQGEAGSGAETNVIGAESGTEAGTGAEAETGTEAETGEETEAGTDEEGGETDRAAPEEYDELGTATYDAEGERVPVPQEAFDREILALDAEAVWGMRRDGAAVLSQLYDPVDEADGVRSTATSQLDEERTLTVPDAVVDHWAENGGWSEEGGDLVFATTDDLESEDLLVVVPDSLREDVLGESE